MSEDNPVAADEQAGAPAGAWTLWHVRGVPVRVEASWLVLAGLVVWFFLNGFGPSVEVLGPLGTVVTGAAVAALLFASILAHELGHALSSLRRGIPVHGITLFLMGGYTESATEAKRPRDEIITVGLGPVVSLLLAGVFWTAFRALGDSGPLGAVLAFFAWANLALGIFNLVPGYPLDGGRLLRGVLWGLTGRPHLATRWAARVGQGFGLLVAGWGLSLIVRAGGGFSGLWEILIGLFLYRGAAAAHRRAAARERLGRRRVRDVMGSVPPALPAGLSLAEALERMEARPSLPWPVGTPLVGVLTIARIDAVPDTRWHEVTAGQAAHAPEHATVAADEPLDVAVQRMAAAPSHTLVVVENGQAVGLLTPSLLGPLLGEAAG